MYSLKPLILAATVVGAIGLTASAAKAEETHIAHALADLEFHPMEGLPMQMAVLSGNPGTGPSAVMLKFPPNFPGGMHHHTHGYHAIVVSGASKHWVKGQSESDAPLQTPGDYWYQAGEEVHQDSFPTDAETILFLRFEGPIDSFFHD